MAVASLLCSGFCHSCAGTETKGLQKTAVPTLPRQLELRTSGHATDAAPQLSHSAVSTRPDKHAPHGDLLAAF